MCHKLRDATMTSIFYSTGVEPFSSNPCLVHGLQLLSLLFMVRRLDAFCSGKRESIRCYVIRGVFEI